MADQKQILQLDGIRALAFVMVLVDHAGFPGHLLWSSVDLFFVLSGFLITGILLSQKKDDTFFRKFYTRRFLRIFPAFYAILIFSILVLPQVSGLQAFCTSIFLANFYMPFIDYSNAPESYWALGPYWTLSLEEQFYLLWPLVVYKLKPRHLLWICASVMVAAPLFRGATFLYLYKTGIANDESVWMLPWNRMDLLAAGAAIAICRHKGLFDARSMAQFGAWLCLGCAVTMVIAMSTIPQFRLSGHTLLFSTVGFSIVCGMMSGLIMYLASSTDGLIVRFLSLKPLAYIGTITYTMYLVHASVIVLSKRAGIVEGNWRLPLVAWVVSFLIAVVCWHSFELPIKRLKDGLNWKKATATNTPPVSRSI